MEMMLDQEGDGFINECIYEDAEPSTSRNLDNQNQSPEVLSSSEQSSSSADTDTDVDNDNQHDQSKKNLINQDVYHNFYSRCIFTEWPW